MIGFIRVGIPVATAAAVLLNKESVRNDSRRKFYEDESEVVPVPGTVEPAQESEVEILGPNRLIDGVSVRSPRPIEKFFKSARESVSDVVSSVQSEVNSGYTKLNQSEQAIASTVSKLHNKSEDLLPNSLYIAIATLSGTIIGRQRSIIGKVLYPLVLGTVSFRYFLPQTFKNTTGFIWDLEQKNLPQLAQSQQLALQKADELATQVEQSSESSKQYLQKTTSDLRKSLADIAGLNIDEDVTKK